MALSQHGAERVNERVTAILGAESAGRLTRALGEHAGRDSVTYVVPLDRKYQVGASNGDTLAFVFENGRLITVMLRRSSQTATPAKFRTARVVRTLPWKAR